MTDEEYLRLKWGTLKAWNINEDNEKAIAALRRWEAEGSCVSAACQEDTETQKQSICDLIDAINGPITRDWTGESMTKEEAKQYVLIYGTDAT